MITLAGDAAGLKAAVLTLFERTLAAIDLARSTRASIRGSAPSTWCRSCRFEGVTMADCVALAREVGAEVAARFGVPVYLYEEAATTPARRNLEDIRRGEFEGLAAKMAAAGVERPTSGRRRPTPRAGATVIGARMPLIAYNINLATDRARRRQEDRRRRPPQQRRPALREGDGRDARATAASRRSR